MRRHGGGIAAPHQPRAAEVEVRGDDGDAPTWWQLRVQDDGRGFDPREPHPGHYGLTGLREQAAQLGGELRIDSAPGQGCRVVLRFAA